MFNRWSHKGVTESSRFAKTINDPVACAVARSIGQGAHAHMADHCMGAALYAQKAVIMAGNSVSDEKAWQIEKLWGTAVWYYRTVLRTMQVKARGLGLPEDKWTERKVVTTAIHRCICSIFNFEKRITGITWIISRIIQIPLILDHHWTGWVTSGGKIQMFYIYTATNHGLRLICGNLNHSEEEGQIPGVFQ